MAKQLQLRKGTEAEHNTFTGANGEVTVDTTNKTLRVHDGSTVGGHVVGAVEDTLTSDSASKGLSARQGKVLQDTKSTVAVMTGTIADGGTIPLPSGFTEAQCKWIVSPSDTTLCSLGANNQGADFFQLKCFTTGRVVTAQISFYNNTTGLSNTYDKSHTVNYMIIGVK